MRLIIYTNNKYYLIQQGMLERFISLTWKRCYNDVGEFALTLPFTADDFALLQPGRYLQKQGDDEPMLITYRGISEDKDGKEILTVKGKSLLHLLNWLEWTNLTTYGKNTNGTKFDPPQHTIYLLTNAANVQEDQVTSTGISAWRNLISFQNRIAYTTGITYRPDGLQNIQDEVLALAKGYGFGVRIHLLNVSTPMYQKLEYEAYLGVNRSAGQSANARCIFAEHLNNIAKQTYEESIENEKQIAYVSHSGAAAVESGYSKLMVRVDGDTTRDFDRAKQMAVDASSISLITTDTTSGGVTITTVSDETRAAILQTGRNALAEHGKTQGISFRVAPGASPVYRTDYDLGDTATFVNRRWGIQTDFLISEVTETYENNHEEIELTIGDSVTTMLRRVKQIARER